MRCILSLAFPNSDRLFKQNLLLYFFEQLLIKPIYINFKMLKHYTFSHEVLSTQSSYICNNFLIFRNPECFKYPRLRLALGKYGFLGKPFLITDNHKPLNIKKDESSIGAV